METATAFAPGRICLAGEDLDWIGGSCILCAIDLGTNVEVSASKQPHVFEIIALGSVNSRLLLPDNRVGCYSLHILDYVNASVKVLRDFGVNVESVTIKISSNLPSKAGLASSAALTVAVIKALCSYSKIALSSLQIAHLAFLVEKDELKTGAGQMDQYSCAVGGLIYIDCGTIPPLNLEKIPVVKSNIMIVDTLTPRNTSDIIRHKRERFVNNDPSFLKYVNKTKILVDEMHSELISGRPDIKLLGRLLNQCHQTLRDDMKVSTDTIEKCVSILLNNGAFGVKITGTGAGGCVFGLVPDGDCQSVREKLMELAVKVYVSKPFDYEQVGG
ncbi:MAG: hypothetical protein LBQ02_02205 [Candidatus Nomurabacteria bacterium]|jgi:galactokinase|nr:hypothetical protein [Candidatus Nomurabacteria bacterium]